MGALIVQMVGCLLVAATIGLMMGWLLRSFATSEKRQQLSEIAGRLRGREHELDTLNHELKVRTSAVQMLEGKMITSEAALKDLTADLTAKVDQITALQTQLTEQGINLHAAQRERDTLRQEVEDAEATLKAQASGFADMQAQMENAEDVLISRDQEIATLKTWVEQLTPKSPACGHASMNWNRLWNGAGGWNANKTWIEPARLLRCTARCRNSKPRKRAPKISTNN